MAKGDAVKIVERYQDLVDDGYDRWNQALDDARRRKYSSTSLISDVLASWADVADAWALPFDILKSKRTLRIPLKQGVTDVTEATVIPSSGPFVATSDPLTDKGGNITVDPAKITVSVLDGGRVLQVQLKGLDPKLAIGTHSGPIKRADDSTVRVAFLILDVSA